jgi:hypothetical protein
MVRPILVFASSVVLVMSIAAAPVKASASCADRKMTGTVVGGIGGALIGNSISKGGGGAIIGGLGGAVVGHEIAKSGCRGYRASRYYSDRRRYGSYRGEPQAVRYVYYDQYGNAVSEGPAPGAAARPMTYGNADSAACHAETQSYYDDRGALVQRRIQICPR